MGTPSNKKMQQTRHGQNGASLLILVFDGPLLMTGLPGETVLGGFDAVDARVT